MAPDELSMLKGPLAGVTAQACARAAQGHPRTPVKAAAPKGQLLKSFTKLHKLQTLF